VEYDIIARRADAVWYAPPSPGQGILDAHEAMTRIRYSVQCPELVQFCLVGGLRRAWHRDTPIPSYYTNVLQMITFVWVYSLPFIYGCGALFPGQSDHICCLSADVAVLLQCRNRSPGPMLTTHYTMLSR
jgi:hypothetical protein